MIKINEKGFWETDTGIGHIYDKSISDTLLNFFKEKNIKSVVDFGCGMGDYANDITSNGIYCEAYDGNPNTENLTRGLGKVLDLSIDVKLKNKFDCVVSLEVGEHIPKEFENVFIENLCKNTNDYIVLSWAVENQGGDGHVNCQNNDYIIDKIKNKGFLFDNENSEKLRKSTSVAFWFKNTIMVFKKNIM